MASDSTPHHLPAGDARGRVPTVVESTTFLGPATLHPRLDALLRGVQAAERSAVGPHRRPTFRLMRELLGAAVQLEVPAQALADCLGTSVGAVRSRANSAEGTMVPELVHRLTGLTPRELDRLSGGQLHSTTDPQSAPLVYRTVDVVRALLSTPRFPTEPTEVTD